jgi:ribulose-phosphate 3-epimerase
MIRIAPSMLCSDFTALGREVAALVEAGADWLHFDCMDGHFVENLTFGPVFIQALRPLTDIPFDVHLMISNPDEQIERYAEAGADNILVQREADDRPVRLLNRIRALGKKAGIVYNPATSLHDMEVILPWADVVLVMSVEPGAAGQRFLPVALEKIAALRDFVDVEGLPTLIAVDGGVNRETAPQVLRAGADVIVSGSWLFEHPDGYAGAISELRRIADEVQHRAV